MGSLIGTDVSCTIRCVQNHVLSNKKLDLLEFYWEDWGGGGGRGHCDTHTYTHTPKKREKLLEHFIANRSAQ